MEKEIIYRALENDELEIWFEFCGNTFGIGADYFRKHYYNDPEKEIRGIFVAIYGNEIVSTLRVFHRQIYYKGEKIKAAGLGEVCTDDKYRKQGLSSKLIESAKDYIRENNFKISVLGASVPKFYEKRGWSGRELRTLTSNVKKAEYQTLIFDKIDFKQDLKFVQETYYQFSSKYNGAFVRETNNYWNKWIKYEMTKYSDSLIVYDNLKNKIAYVVLSIKDNKLEIVELCYTDSDFDVIIQNLLYYLNKDNMQISYPSIFDSKLELIQSKTDNAYMYLNLDKTNDYCDVLGNNGHIFWKLDAF